MTATLSPEVAAMLAEIQDASAPKKKKNAAPELDAPPNIVANAKRRQVLKAEIAERETEMKGLDLDIVKWAAPEQLRASRQIGVHVGTVKIRGVCSLQCRPPHYTTKITDPARVCHIMTLWGNRFTEHWRFLHMIPETPEIVACLKAAGIKYPKAIAPLKALHEGRSVEPAIEAMLATVPEVKPIWAICE